MSYSLTPSWLHPARLLCPPLSPRVCSNSCPLSQWCHPTISSSAAPFSSCLQSFPASGSFLMSRLFASGSQSIGVSASATVLPINILGWFPLIVCFDLLAVQRTLKSLHQHHSSKARQNPLQYCKVISLQLVKINEKKKSFLDKKKPSAKGSREMTLFFPSALTILLRFWRYPPCLFSGPWLPSFPI